MNKLKNEPAVITSVLVALVGAAATLGIIGTDQQDQLVAAITALVPIVGGLIIRANVTPNAKAKVSINETAFKAATEPADPPVDDAPVAVDPTPAPEPAPAEPAPAPAEDPVKAQLKAAIETVRANSNAQNDARAQAAKAAVDASS